MSAPTCDARALYTAARARDARARSRARARARLRKVLEHRDVAVARGQQNGGLAGVVGGVQRRARARLVGAEAHEEPDGVGVAC
jgi:hypothetical protein